MTTCHYCHRLAKFKLLVGLLFRFLCGTCPQSRRELLAEARRAGHG